MLHDNELSIDLDLVNRLVQDSFPEFGKLPVQPLAASGSSNQLFKLGDEFVVRLPRQPGGGKALLKEAQWLPQLREQLPLEIPEVVGVGNPIDAFTEHWLITHWIQGDHPQIEQTSQADQPAIAYDLAEFVVALRTCPIPKTALTDASLRWYRGRPLREFDAEMQKNLLVCKGKLGRELDLDTAAAIWAEALRLPETDTSTRERWFHSDLVAENLLLRNGVLAAVLDFGTLAIGDPTIDLHGAWELFDAEARQIFRDRLAVNETDWLRGRAWGLAIACGALAYYWGKMPARCEARLSMARAVLADFENK